MTSAPDPAHISEPSPPRDPAEFGARRRGPGLVFWAAAVFAVVFILAGAGISLYGPSLFPSRPAARAVVAAGPAPAAPAPVAANPGREAIAPVPSVPPASRLLASPAQIEALNGRLDRLEVAQRAAALAAARALAAADLSQAAQGSRPFADSLAADERLLPDTADLRALRGLALTGAPSRAALAADLAGLADRAVVASSAPVPGAGLVAHLAHALMAVFTLRRIDRTTGAAPDAVLARAQQRANDGDIEGALQALGGLSPAGQGALAEWRARAQRRVEIDRRIAGLRSDALRGLADAAAEPPASSQAGEVP